MAQQPPVSQEQPKFDEATLKSPEDIKPFADFMMEKAGLVVEPLPIETEEQRTAAGQLIFGTVSRAHHKFTSRFPVAAREPLMTPGLDGKVTFRQRTRPGMNSAEDIERYAHGTSPSVPVVIKEVPASVNLNVLEGEFFDQNVKDLHED